MIKGLQNEQILFMNTTFYLYTVHTNQDVANVCPRRQILVNREIVWGHVELKVGMLTDYNRNCGAAT